MQQIKSRLVYARAFISYAFIFVRGILPFFSLEKKQKERERRRQGSFQLNVIKISKILHQSSKETRNKNKVTQNSRSFRLFFFFVFIIANLLLFHFLRSFHTHKCWIQFVFFFIYTFESIFLCTF